MRFKAKQVRVPLLIFFLLMRAPELGASQCSFTVSQLAFEGSPVEQARCLLRPVKKWGHLDTPLQSLPTPFDSLIGQPVSLKKQSIKKYLTLHKIDEAQIGGNLTGPISRANNNNSQAPVARYFVVHDTSFPNYLDKAFPENINHDSWRYNDLGSWMRGFKSSAHVFINRTGESITAIDFKIPWRATQFEVQYLKVKGKGLFLHIELIQPRRSEPNRGSGNDAIAPEPGFTKQQIKRLALVYTAASIRRGKWLIPAYHAILDTGFKNAHDDPQNFNLFLWAACLERLIKDVQKFD